MARDRTLIAAMWMTKIVLVMDSSDGVRQDDERRDLED
jgi:hypothetical protein